MDRHLALIAFLVLLICSALLLEDMRWIEIPGWSNHRVESTELVGKISSLHNQVKRRGQQDFLWSRTKQQDQLFMNDSILTASGSRASIELFGKSKIELSENTLVVLEPPAKDSSQVIRLKFNTGALSSSLSEKAQVDAGEYEIKVEAGTEFHLRTQGSGYELELLKGSAQVISENKESVSIKENEALIMSEGKIENISVSSNLEWKHKAFLRLYSFDEKIKTQLNWNGNAEKLILLNKENKNQEIILDQNKNNNIELELSAGSHFIRLKEKNNYSPLLAIEVLKSPTIHLYSPLPRDRVKLETKSLFVWKKQIEASTYNLELASDTNFVDIIKTIQTKDNFVEYKPDFIGRFYWRVTGLDQDGFHIPASYSNEIIFVDNPLEAPDVKPENQLRSPAKVDDKSSSLRYIKNPWLIFLQLFIDIANAEEVEKRIVRFYWNKVDSAELYQIEIDDDPYFQSPEIITTSKNNYFDWSTYKRSVVYWRVAGDSYSTGRMGLFSNVQKADLNLLRFDHSQSEPFDVFIYREPPKVEISSNIEETSQVAETKPKAPETQETPLNIKEESKHTWLIGYGFGYGSYQIQSAKVSLTKLQGLEPVQVFAERIIKNENSFIKIRTGHSINNWKIKNTKQYPFQNQVNSWVGDVNISFADNSKCLWLGGILKKDLTTERVDRESINLKTQYLLGPTLHWDKEIENGFFNSISSSALFGSDTYGIGVSNFVRFRTKVTPYFFSNIGLKLDYQALSVRNAGTNIFFGSSIFIGSEW